MPDVSPPLQQRSRETLNAISKATMRLLEQRTFEELTIAEIVKASGSSTGSFYARFNGKEALLHYLHETYASAGREHIKMFVEANGPEPLSVEVFAERLMPALIISHFENHGLLRAVAIKTFDNPQFSNRALDLVRWIATRLSTILVNPKSSRQKHIQVIERSIRDVSAILDQDLFFQSGKRPSRVDAKRLRRMQKILVASLKAGQTTA